MKTEYHTVKTEYPNLNTVNEIIPENTNAPFCATSTFHVYMD